VSCSPLRMYDRAVGRFAFLTNHGLVLLCIAEDARVRMREIAAAVQITERAAQRIVADLIEAGYVDRARDGRRNRYTVRRNLPITLPSRRDIELNSLLTVLMPSGSSHARRDETESGTQPAAA
jgi:MarR family